MASFVTLEGFRKGLVTAKHIYGTLWFILIVLAMTGCGRRVMRLLKISPATFPGEIATSFAIGIPLWYLLMQVIGHLGLLRKPLLMALVVAGIITGRGELVRMVRQLGGNITAKFEGGWFRLLGSSLLLIFFVLFFILSFSPTVLDDAEYYHFDHPKRFLDAGRIYYIANNLCSDYPFAYESLTLLGLGTGGESTANLFNWFLMLMTVLLHYDIGVGFGSSEAGLTMGVVLIGINGGWEFGVPGCIEPLLLLASVGAIHHGVRWMRGPTTADAIMTGLYLGLLGATKYNGLMLVAYLLGVFLLTLLFPALRKIRLMHLGLVIVIFCILVAPFLGRNLIKYGNPVYPFLQTAIEGQVVPGADDISTWRIDEPPTFVGGVKHFFILTTKIIYPYTSFAFVLFPLIFILLIRDTRVLIPGVYVILHFIFAYIMMPWNPRYFLPADALMIYIIGVAVARIKLTSLRAIFMSLMIIPLLINISPIYGVARVRLPVALGIRSEPDYLISTYSFYKVIFKANSIIKPGEKVWFLDRKGFRLDADYIAYLPTPTDWQRSDEDLHRMLTENGVDWILVSRPHWNALVSIDAILTSLRPGGPDDVRLYWDDITQKLAARGLSEEYAGDIIFSIGAETAGRGKYTIDMDAVYTKWPGLDFLSAMASSFEDMAKEGYLEEVYMDGSGWIYKVNPD